MFVLRPLDGQRLGALSCKTDTLVKTFHMLLWEVSSFVRKTNNSHVSALIDAIKIVFVLQTQTLLEKIAEPPEAINKSIHVDKIRKQVFCLNKLMIAKARLKWDWT